MEKCLFSLLFLLIPFFLKGQNFDAQKLDSYLDTLFINDKFMGAVTVWQNNKETYNKNKGFSNATMHYLATENTSYKISRIAQIFAVTLILKALEEGKLKLEDKLNKFFPLLNNSHMISIDNLLRHTTGISDFIYNLPVNHTQKYSKQDIFNLINQQVVNPTEIAVFSDVNYILMAFILEKIYKKNYSEIVKKYIIKPLHLKNTSLIAPKSVAFNYYYVGSWIELINADNSIYYGTKTLYSSTKDICIFIDALFNGKIIKAENIIAYNILSDNSIFRIKQNQFKEEKLKYWAMEIDSDAIENTVFLFFPEQKTIISIVENALNYNLQFIIQNVIASVFNFPYKIPEFNRPQVYIQEELYQFIGIFVTDDRQMNIRVKVQDSQLILETEGEVDIVLSSVGVDKFANFLSDIQIEFSLDRQFFLLKKGALKIVFNREYM